MKNKPTDKLWTSDFIFVVLTSFMIFTGFQMLPVMLPAYIKSLGAPDYLLGWVSGVTTIAAIFSRPVAGIAIDRFGRKGLLVVGVICMALASVCYTFFPIISIILIIRFFQGVAWGFANTAVSTAASDLVPHSRFSEGMSWFAQAGSLAQVIAPGISLSIFYSIGARVSIYLSVAMFLVGLIFALFIRYRHNEPRRRIPTEEQRLSLKLLFHETVEKRALVPALLMLLVTTAFGTTVTWMATVVTSRGVEGLAWFFVVFAGVSLLTRPLFGRSVDRNGYTIPTIAGLSCVVVAMIVLNFAFSTPLLLLAAALQGLGQSACYATLHTMAAANAAPDRRGTAMATFMLGFDIGIGVGAVCASLAAQALGYDWLFLCIAIFPIFALVWYLILNLLKKIPSSARS
jgi:MFS family permease